MTRAAHIASAILALATLALNAVAVNFRAIGPSQWPANKPFQIQYVVDDKSDDVQLPDMSGFELLYGPATSVSSSVSYINGSRTSTYQKTYTYTLLAAKPGTYSLGPATVRVGGKAYKSNGLKITISKEQEDPAAQTTSSRRNSSGEASRSRSDAGQESVYVRTIVNKTRVREQEAITLSYKIYFAGVRGVQLASNPEIPDFAGFLKQEVDLQQPQETTETINGRPYTVATLYKAQLYPQHSGEISIPPVDFEVLIPVKQQRRGSVFDDFFDSYTNVQRTLRAQGVTIQVDALPQADKPSNFSGGVGHFTLTPSISSTDLVTNSPVTIRLDITGNGNIKLVKTPDIRWPEGFEAYDAKVTNSYRNTDEGMTGTKSIEYLAIPRESGDYTVAPITLSYYNSQTGHYETLSTPEYHLHVKKGNASSATTVQDYSDQEAIRQVANDVRYIHTSPIKLTSETSGTSQASQASHSSPTSPAGEASTPLWAVLLAYLLPLIAAIVAAILLRRRIRLNADVVGSRSRRAGRVAQKRLKEAERLLKENDAAHFYEEIERAILSYLSDRMALSMADMNKEQIAELLRTRGADEARIKDTLEVISTAEFARYAPSTSSDMHTLYQSTVTLINQLEETTL